ncbi:MULTISPECIES: trigger factor [Kushneria]|uniref:Trigger factor n=2 Tax=Kushneria TaxID=504090 RepID=A0A240UL62_9GAMM|nr:MULTISPECIES: trigger factor [Kushneria]ARS53892.1 trigger factor [Kushneria konosiri]ART61760.1 trigger factor [Kushneria marisflavi]RKD86786.1 trigger factor [Kushneria marisflavi]
MQVSVETTSPIERRVTVQVPAQEVDKNVDERLKDTARRVRLDGFRSGRVPMSVVRQRFGRDVRNEVVDEVMRQHYVRAITENELNPAGYPSLEATVNEAGKDLEFVATLEVYPSIELTLPEDEQIERPQAEISDADIDEMIDTLRKQNAQWNDVERAAADGDQITIDFEGFLGDEPFEGGSAEGHQLVLGSNSFIPGFEDQLVGVQAGEEREVTVTFPEDYQAEHLAGQEARFKTTTHKVQAQELPEVDAEFMSRFGVEDGDNDSFRKEVRNNMQRELDNAIDNRVRQQLIDALKARNEVSVPSSLISQEVEGLKRQAAQQFGLGDDFDVSQLPDELFAEQARGRVEVGLLLAEVVSHFELDADDDEIRAFIEEQAGQFEQPEQVVEQYMGNEQMKNQVKSAVLERKAIDRLLDKASVVETPMSYQEALQAAQQQNADEAEETEEQAG